MTTLAPDRVADHSHCPAIGCYWRIQYMTVCSRCGGQTVQVEGCCTPAGRAAYLAERREEHG